jgi:hypothetical protein
MGKIKDDQGRMGGETKTDNLDESCLSNRETAILDPIRIEYVGSNIGLNGA